MTRIYIEIAGGALQGVYGDPLPEGVEVEFILRDMDNIEAGDEDPLPDGIPGEHTFYW